MTKNKNRRQLKKVEGFIEIPFASIAGFLQTAYSEEYLEKICIKIGIEDEDKRTTFSRGVRHAGRRYIELKRANPKSIQPNVQNKILTQYKKALQEAQLKYREIYRFSSTSIKLEKAIRKKYEETAEPGMREMFNPYCNETGLATTIFDKFLGVLIDAADDAKHQNIGHDKADFSSELLTGWVAAIGKFWPNEASITFALGKRDKQGKIYTSRSISILHELITRIEHGISDKKIENAMRKVSKNNMVKQPLAIFFLG